LHEARLIIAGIDDAPERPVRVPILHGLVGNVRFGSGSAVAGMSKPPFSSFFTPASGLESIRDLSALWSQRPLRAEERTLESVDTIVSFWPILLKNSSAQFFDFVQGVVEPLAECRSSILSDSKRSIFLRDGSHTMPTEFFNRIGR
jgi:hypothetical protein